MNASPNDGIDRTMKYCKCDKPKEWQGDNYCRECNGLIESRLKAPSATVDEMREKMANCIATYCDKRVRDGDFDFFDAEVYIGELLKYLISDLHSQQEKRYTRNQMIAFGQRMRSGSHYSDEYIGKQLDQFDKEGK